MTISLTKEEVKILLSIIDENIGLIKTSISNKYNELDDEEANKLVVNKKILKKLKFLLET